MNPFTALIDWLDENADYAPIGAFIGLGIALVLAFTLGAWPISHHANGVSPWLFRVSMVVFYY